MNREIKFRGKSADNGEWIIGDLIQYESGEMAIFSKKLSQYGYEATEILNRSKVLPETIGQFTGLLDKNGKEIYEGDMLLMGEDEGVRIYNKVGIKDGCFGYIGETNGEILPFCHYNVTEEIAGNIYDHPELIKEE
ncbi:YopX family protein [Bacteroides finegoldii]|uniref:YopX family protein n=1 Tax=Bacteroides finegoldii TaxID=338188 RepID=UPI00189F197E|nr:YopX family protein [Bacteroides finegoldii]